MTRARFTHRAGEYALRVTGHADFHPGSDIVCAAASTLVCTLAAALGELGADVTALRLQPGDAVIAARAGEGVDTAFRVACTGFRQLAAAYPENVQFTQRPAEQAASPRLTTTSLGCQTKFKKEFFHDK